jgi:hypothetical protein
MSKLTLQVEKERVEFIFFDVPLTEVVLELNKLIIKYGESVSLSERYDEHNFDNSTYYYVYVEEQESDEAHEDRLKYNSTVLKYNSTVEFAEREELKRLKEKYPFDI